LTYNGGSGVTFSITTFNIEDGGRYIHNRAAATPLNTATGRNFSSNSTVEIQQNLVGLGAALPTFGNLIINSSAAVQMAGYLSTVNGTLTKQNTGDFRLATTQVVNLTIGGNLNVQGGTMTIQSETTANTASVSVAGSVSIGSATLQRGANATGLWTFNVGGNWTNNGIFTSGNSTVTFNGSGEQTIGGSAVTAFNNLTVNSGATVVIPTSNTPTVAGALTNNGALRQTRSVSGSSDIEFLNVSTNKYYGVMINPGGNNLGSTTVTVYGNQMCSAPPSLGKDPILRCFEIQPTSQQAATVRLYYRTAELNSNNASTVNIYHQKSGQWNLEEGTYTRETDPGDGYYSVQVTGVDEYSPFTAGNHGPTLIHLASFTATPQPGRIHLAWTTDSETDNYGFHVWRAQSAGGPYTRLNAALIPARGGPTQGASYTFDDAAVTDGVTYYYKLEDVDVHGASVFHGPAVALAGRFYRLYLPLVARE